MISKAFDAFMAKARQYCNKTTYFYLTLLACFCVLWIMFVHTVGIQTKCIVLDFIHCLGDMLIILLPFWFVGKRWRIVPLVLLWLFAVLLISNVWYFRFWGDVLSPISISMVGNLNEEVTDSVSMLWHNSDVRFFIFPLIATISFFFFRPVNARYSKEVKVWMTVAAIVIFIFGRMFDGSSAATLTNSEFTSDTGKAPKLRKEVLHMKKGVLLYSLHSIENFRYWLCFNQKLSEKQIEKIDDFLSAVPRADDSAFSDNVDKNLVIVVVESLNGSVVDKEVNGVEVTPTLNRLIATPGTIYSCDVVSQIRDGVSSDGQMMVQTGLLPLHKGSASILVGHQNEFPALPGLFPGYSHYAVFASGGHVWREGRTHEHYGYDVYTKHDYEADSEKLGADGGMFYQGIRLIEADTTRRFLLTMMTASMHVPFVDKAASEIDRWSELPEDLRNYYTVCHYFDEQLGLFINVLKDRGLYDDTIIVVTSDHCQMATSDGAFEPAFFGAFNTGVTYHVPGYVGQVSIYPTILQIMHRTHCSDDIYHGLAPGMLDAGKNSSLDGHGHVFGDSVSERQFEAYEISDMIIRGDYFNK